MKWFRVPSEIILQDYRRGTLRPSTFRFWIDCLCVSARHNLKGKLPDDEALVFYSRHALHRVRWHIGVLVEAGILGRDETTGNAFIVDWSRLHDPKTRVNPKGWQALRLRVFDRDNFTCRYCGASGVKLHCDHVHPYSRGGGSDLENLVTACSRCNSSKRDKTPEEWRS